MAKLRVHELAKLVNKTSKEVLAVLRQQGEDIQSHMSTVNEEQASKIKARFLKMDAGKNPAPAAAPKADQNKTAPAQAKPAKPVSEKSARSGAAPVSDESRPAQSRTEDQGARPQAVQARTPSSLTTRSCRTWGRGLACRCRWRRLCRSSP